MNSATIIRLYQKLSDSRPDPRSELVYNNHFELLVSVILSAQATDKTVNSVTPELFSRYPTPESILQCGRVKLEGMIKTIGLAPSKAKNIIASCKLLVREHSGRIPQTREALERLPGVGRKTANVVLNEGFGHPTLAVDTHVFRVSNRTGLAPGKNVLETEKKLLEVTPRKWLKSAHRHLILHGRYVCKARKPDCPTCVINDLCTFMDKTLPHQ